MALDRAADQWSMVWSRIGEGRLASGRLGFDDVLLATTLDWMNCTGPVVGALMRRYGASPDDVVVVHDDLDLPLGRIRIKRDGGSGGHNGLRSIITALETPQFCRVKIGIGQPTPAEVPADYVLSPFSHEELDKVAQVLDRAVSALECLIRDGPDAAMNRFNLRAFTE